MLFLPPLLLELALVAVEEVDLVVMTSVMSTGGCPGGGGGGGIELVVEPVVLVGLEGKGCWGCGGRIFCGEIFGGFSTAWDELGRC